MHHADHAMRDAVCIAPDAISTVLAKPSSHVASFFADIPSLVPAQPLPHGHDRATATASAITKGYPLPSTQGVVTNKEFLPFKKALAYVRRLKLKSQKHWFAWCKSGRRPVGVPSAPDRVYVILKLLDLGGAPYVLYGVKFIDLVSLAPDRVYVILKI